MAEKKKILYIVEAMGGGVFTYIVDLANELVKHWYTLEFCNSNQVRAAYAPSFGVDRIEDSKLNAYKQFLEMLQLLLRLGTFQLSDIFYNTVGGVLGGLLYCVAMKVRKRL